MLRAFDSSKVPAPKVPPDCRLPSWLGGDHPLDLEIGCGVGWHPISYAQSHPLRNLIAIEHTREKFSKFSRRYEQNDSPKNLMAVHANAVSWVSHFIPACSIDQAFLLYPNLEPKNPAKRWFKMPFIFQLLTALKPSGEIHLRTNSELYNSEALELSKSLGLQITTANVVSKIINPSFRPETHFERKYFELGQKLFLTVLRKT